MTNEERFVVDLEGYLVIKNVLAENEVLRMNQIIDSGDRSRSPSRWGKFFNKLIDHPKILPYLIELIGPSVRLDHDYAIFMQNDTQIGQTIHWKIETSAIGPPGQKVESHIKYGRGIWKEMELADLMVDFGIASKAGAWIKLPNGEKVQGKNNLAKFLEENPDQYEEFEKEVFDTVGIERNN